MAAVSQMPEGHGHATKHSSLPLCPLTASAAAALLPGALPSLPSLWGLCAQLPGEGPPSAGHLITKVKATGTVLSEPALDLLPHSRRPSPRPTCRPRPQTESSRLAETLCHLPQLCAAEPLQRTVYVVPPLP